MGPHLLADVVLELLAADVGLLSVLHGCDQTGQPKPAARLAPPYLVLPFWPHRLPRSRRRIL
ncbi:hypothetical protein JQ554_02085 [Bradyrhizobium diazoefficiens]|nr:hypothetical protein [Bradyrhizobium diazoefficiens]MBR0962855.1 hypothetical protein [Bradyrhizobium diazoefficiens]MBR0977015.1 hypothetical protein [Bradyrhizobium diazoefficiens]MBR1005660.1 hypothetical protein [Bradyrhizobium diazoefficiens]MBR1012133.1 hypothetical protein [Bradyrhizobium diazoefficiens]MBR1049474.1 hypothetical protein [Bradyrhizobium diazoefficiens]